MNRHGITTRTIAVVFFALTLCSFVQAQERYHVSGAGNDANNCFRLSPCRTFQRAHDVAVSGDEIVALDSAGYGPVVITKSISISGEGHYAGITTYATKTSITINSATAVVVLRNLHLHGLNGIGDNGIVVTDAAAVHVDNCVIQGMKLNGLAVNASANAGMQLFVTDTVIRNNLLNGALVAAGKAVFENCRFEKNSQNGASLSAGFSIFHNCVMAGNGIQGLLAFGSGTKGLVDQCQISNNGTGIASSTLAQVRVSNSNVTGNTNGLVALPPSSILTRQSLAGAFSNTVEDNGIDGAFTGTYTAK